MFYKHILKKCFFRKHLHPLYKYSAFNGILRFFKSVVKLNSISSPLIIIAASYLFKFQAILSFLPKFENTSLKAILKHVGSMYDSLN